MAIDRSATTAYAGIRYAPRPARPTAARPVGRLMTEAQRDFVVKLITAQARAIADQILAVPTLPTLPKGVDENYRQAMAADMVAPARIIAAVQDTLNRTDIGARDLIESLIAKRDKEQRAARALRPVASRAELAVGTYRDAAGDVFRVVPSQGSGRLYATKWDGETWTFAKGAVARLTADMRLTEEQERAFGQATGNCCRCGRLLTDPESIEYGIGPICRGK